MFEMVLVAKNSLIRVPVIKHGFVNRQSFSFTPPPTTRRATPGRRKRTKTSSLTIISLLAFLFFLNILQTNMPADNAIRVGTSIGNQTPRNLSRSITFD